ncbi:AAA family ATPase [Paraburkholderia sp. Tr-20389]|uniref:AAA family ATPase n=1 Tax=Paraburkholderia sp. Tr-20389 TaxID=2703903 RepID=UPI001980B996|nr:AAA family ATPase [Paraburkholderia sp. Tr-20389]
MILESITIQNFRKLTDRIVIDGLESGLNLISGPNEAGKSTIAEAVRTVFLDRYKVSGLDALVPASRPDSLPTVEVGFDIGGTKHHLVKQFVKKQRCNLRVGSKTFDGDEAEAILADTIGFTRPKQGLSRAEHAGIPGLLWVRQGQTGDVRKPGEHASTHVRAALSQLTGGEMPGGDDALIAAVQKDLFKLITSQARRPTGELAAVEKELENLKAEQAALEQSNREFDEDIVRLGKLQREHDNGERERPWDALRQKAAAALAQAQQNDVVRREHDEVAQQLKIAEAEHRVLLEQEQFAANLEASVATDRRDLDKADAIAAQAGAAHLRAQASDAAAQKAGEAAQQAHGKAIAAESAAQYKALAQTQQTDIARIDAALARAIESNEKVLELTRVAANLELDEKKVKRLQQVSDQLVPLQVQKNAALTRIEYRLSAAITVDGAPVQGDGTLVLDGRKTIGLPGFGELTIVPGTLDLSALDTQLQGLEAERDKLLLALGVESHAQGAEQLARWKSVCVERNNHAQMLRTHAPDGVDALRSELEQARGRLGATQAKLDALEDATGAIPVAQAKDAVDAARVQIETARTALLDAATASAQAAAGAKGIRERLAVNEARLKEAAFIDERKRRQAALVEKKAYIDEYTRNLDAAAQRLSAVSLDDPRADADRYNRSAELEYQQHLERQRNAGQLRTRLETLGGTELGVRLAQTAAAIEQAEVRRAELRMRADALSLLESVLVEERDTAVATLRKPLTDRVNHYLRRVFPTGELAVDDSLSPVGLMRETADEAFESLSYGTQEQLGLLVRLAYADLLKDAGKPTLLLFDDAIVHTDEERRESIKRALLDAATRHQILVFTCHPSAWSDLGVKQRRLEDIKAAARLAG